MIMQLLVHHHLHTDILVYLDTFLQSQGIDIQIVEDNDRNGDCCMVTLLDTNPTRSLPINLYEILMGKEWFQIEKKRDTILATPTWLEKETGITIESLTDNSDNNMSLVNHSRLLILTINEDYIFPNSLNNKYSEILVSNFEIKKLKENFALKINEFKEKEFKHFVLDESKNFTVFPAISEIFPKNISDISQNINGLLKEILDNIKLSAVILDNVGRIVYCNEYLLNLSNHKMEEISLKNWYEIFVNVNIEEQKSFSSQIKTGLFPLYAEYDIKTSEGYKRRFSWNNTFLKNESEIIGVLFIGEDITEHLKFQQILRENKKQLSEAQTISKTGSWIWDITKDQVIWSEYMYFLAGIPTSKKLTFTNTLEVIRHDYISYISDIFKKAIQNKEQMIEMEYIMVRPDKSEIWVKGLASISYDTYGEAIKVSGTTQDITDLKITEKELTDSQLRWSIAVESANVGVYTYDKENKTLEWDENIYRLYEAPTKIKGDELLQYWKTRIHQEDFENVVNELDYCIIHKTPYKDKQYRIITYNGKIKWLSAWGKIVVDPLTLNTKLTGIIYDISHIKWNEKALRKSEEAFRILFDNMGIGVAQIDLIKGKFVLVNRRFGEILGYPQENIMSLSFIDLLPETEKTKLLSDFAHISKVAIDYSTELQMVHQSNRKIWISLRITPMWQNSDKHGYHIAVINDISDRKIAEESLKLTQARFMAFVDSFPYDFWMCDENNVYIYQNSVSQSYWGDLLNKTTETINQDTTNIEKWKSNNQKVLQGKTVSGERKYLINNRELWLHEVIAPVYLNERIVGIAGINMDITNRKNMEMELRDKNSNLMLVEEKIKVKNFELIEKNEKIEKLNYDYADQNKELKKTLAEIQKMNQELTLEKNKAQQSDMLKSSFLANMSHEIRTPLNAIIGFTDLLDNVGLDPKKRKRYLDVIRQRSDDLLSIINDILDVSKIESGLLNMIFEITDINHVLSEIYEFTYSKLESDDKKHIKLQVENAVPEMFQIVLSDAVRLKQILLNLVGNAIKFTQSGELEIRCELINNEMLQFSVKDTGIGIENEKQTLVFERFRQVDESLTRKHGGTGLGLSICKGLVDLFGGKIWVESELGVGSIFYFTIPFQLPIYEPIEVTPVLNSYTWDENVVLLVEDDESNAYHMQEVLSNTSIHLIHANDGNSAIDIFTNNNSIKLVLMDIRLPDLNGYDITRVFKSIEPRIPIIIQSAFASDDDKRKGFEAGADEFITKPINIKLLMSIINKYLKS